MKVPQLLLPIILLAAAGCAALAERERNDYTVTKAIPYVAAGSARQVGDLYVPAGAGPWPVVLVVHGGGWIGGERDDMNKFATRLARAGYAVFNVGYRLAPEYRFPAQLEDLRSATAWLRLNAVRFRLDSRRMAALGYSAGAHLALLLAYSGDSGIAAVVAGAGPADLTVYPDSPYCKALLDGTPAERPSEYAAASPLQQVSADDPPTFLYHGRLDRLVEVAQSERLHDKLKQTGVTAQLETPSLLGHATLFVFDQQVFADALQFLDRTIGASLPAGSTQSSPPGR